MIQPDANYTVPLLLGDNPTVTSKTFPVTSPRTGETLWHSSDATLAEVTSAITSATTALKSWRTTSLPQRRNLLLKAADALAASADDISAAMQQETAADEKWAAFNITAAIALVRGVAEKVCSIESRLPAANDPEMTALVVKEPYGVILSIAPWNAPIILSIRSLVFPLAGGNAVIFKASELSPRTHYLVCEVFRTAGFPEGVVSHLVHSRDKAAEITEALIKAPEVRKINFTGSTAVGRIIAEIAGRNLKPVTLELGGKAPMIVCEDADIEKAAKGAAFGAFHHAGQICMGTERILVHASVAKPFVEALKKAVEEMYGGGQVMIQQSSYTKVKGLLDGAKAAGAELLSTSKETSHPEFANTIVTGVTTEMDIWRTESFGPIVAITEFTDEDKAVDMANDTDYGLSAGVWSKDILRALKIARRIESGAVHINGTTVHDEFNLPHGGVKNSGYGRFNGDAGLDEFMITKTITIKA